jgi:hypothetical protein
MSRQNPFKTARPLPPIAALGAVAGVLLLGMAGPAAAADSCLDHVRDLAARYGTPSKPPTGAPDRKSDITTQDLARSGGVITPPPVQDKSVITPPSNTRDAMQTVPDVAPQALKEDPAADRTKLQAALTAARAQSERGDEKGCEEALARARTLADRADTKN